MKRFITIALILALATGTNALAAQTLTFWTYNAERGEYMQKKCDEWNKAFPEREISLEVSLFATDMIDEKLWTVLHSGVLLPGLKHPNLVDIEYQNLPRYINPLSWLLYPLAKIMPENPGDAYSAFFYRDMYVGIPVDDGDMRVIYDIKSMASAGIDPAEIVTWDDFISAGREYYKNTGKAMLAVDDGHYLAFLTLYLQTASRDGFALAYENTLKTLTTLFDENIARLMPGGRVDSRSFKEALASGNAGCAFCRLARTDDYADAVYIGKVPKFANETGVWIPGYATCVTTFCDDYTIAMDFLAFAAAPVSNIEQTVLRPINAQSLAALIKSYKLDLARRVMD